MALRVAGPRTPSAAPLSWPRCSSRSCTAWTVSRFSPGSSSGGGRTREPPPPIRSARWPTARAKKVDRFQRLSASKFDVDKEGRPAVPSRQHQGPRLRRGRQGPAVRLPHPEPPPLGQRPRSALVGQLMGKTGRQAHLPAPLDPGLPAQVPQEVGGRRQRVGEIPEIPPPVAVEVHGVAQEHGRHELEVPHGARPGSVQSIARHQVLFQDVQRRQQLPAEPLAPPLHRRPEWPGNRAPACRPPVGRSWSRSPTAPADTALARRTGRSPGRAAAVLARPGPAPVRSSRPSPGVPGNRQTSPRHRAGGDRARSPARAP